MLVSLIGFAALLFLAFLRMPLGLALGIVGGVGFSLLATERAAISNAARLPANCSTRVQREPESR